jgi:hypothetical protein
MLFIYFVFIALLIFIFYNIINHIIVFIILNNIAFILFMYFDILNIVINLIHQ